MSDDFISVIQDHIPEVLSSVRMCCSPHLSYVDSNLHHAPNIQVFTNI